MADRRRERPDELVATAEAFTSELETFGKLTEAVRALQLSSQKSLQKAARLYQDIGQSEGRLGAAAQALLEALGAARQRQQEQADLITARGEEVRQRSEVAAALLQRYAAVGEDAAKVNGMALEVMQLRASGEADEPSMRSSLMTLHDRLSDLVGAAQGLVEEARRVGFDDIAREADSLHQGLRAARERIAQLAPLERTIGQA